MINKGQKKRVRSESDINGKLPNTNKNVQTSKKAKNFKQTPDTGAEVKKIVKSKMAGAGKNKSLPLNQPAGKKAQELKGKNTVLVNSKIVNLKYELKEGVAKKDQSIKGQETTPIKETIKNRKRESPFKLENIKISGSVLKEKIAEIKSRETLSNRAKRMLGALKRKLAIEEGVEIPKREKVTTSTATKSQQRKQRRELAAQRRSENGIENDTTGKSKNEVKPVDIQKFKKSVAQDNKSAVKQVLNKKKLGTVKTELNKKQSAKGAAIAVQEKKQNAKNKGRKNKKQLVESALPKVTIKKEITVEEDDSEDEDEDENESVDNTLNSSLNISADNDDDEDEENEDDDEDEDEDDDDEDDDDDDDEEEEQENIKSKGPQVKRPRAEQQKQEHPVKMAKNLQNIESPEKKKRYVLFVGNLPYDATPEGIKKHFLTKVSSVISVRIPTKPGTKISRGIGYVEVSNDTDYEKALSLHNTTINGRRLNVEYTKTGSKSIRNDKDLVAKNKKLHALRKAGVLAGSQKHDQKRSVRRAKQIKPN